MPKKEEFNGFDDDIFSPDDFDLEDEEIEEETEADDNADEVDQDDDSSQPVEETEENVKTQEELETEQKAKTEADKNAHYAKLRREKEAKEKAQREKEIKEAAKLEAELDLIKKNPYTNETIKDEEDLKIYKLQKAIEEKGGDPISDLPKAIAEENRKAIQAKKTLDEQKVASQKQLDMEAKELIERYPEAINTAPSDQELFDLYNTKEGRMTLTECYEFLKMKREIESLKSNTNQNDKKKKEIVNSMAKKNTSVPSSKSNGGKVSKDYLDMTDEEYLRHEEERNTDFF